jgi:hypothetical protein
MIKMTQQYQMIILMVSVSKPICSLYHVVFNDVLVNAVVIVVCTYVSDLEERDGKREKQNLLSVFYFFFFTHRLVTFA